MPGPAPLARRWGRAALALLMLYLFVSSIKTIGGGLKIVRSQPTGRAYVQSVLDRADNPLAGLFAGILLTSLFQSSSFTTSLVITITAATAASAQGSGQETMGAAVSRAVPIVMGANIGTSVTNMLVSLAHVRRRGEFARASAAAVVHDMFNVLAVLVFFPVELIVRRFVTSQGLLGWLADTCARCFHLPAAEKPTDIIQTVASPVIATIRWFFETAFGHNPGVVGIGVAAAGLILLLASLVGMVRNLRGLMLGRLESLFQRFVFRNQAVGFVVGTVITVLVQSSSVTTSLIIPLAGAGLLGLRQVFPYTLGANVGTTCTGIIAAAAYGTHPALAVAFAHLLFNLLGIMVFWPLQRVPLGLAMIYARTAARRKTAAAVYISAIFFVIPIVGLVLLG